MATKHPKGLKPLFFTEMWERLGFYMMVGILYLYIIDTERGGLGLSNATAGEIYDSGQFAKVMDAALKAGEYIPHLCHNPDFPPHGSCRVCVVNVNGKHVCSCTLPASSNMEAISTANT